MSDGDKWIEERTWRRSYSNSIATETYQRLRKWNEITQK